MQLLTDYESDFLGELSLRVDYDYQPGEAMQPNPDHPGFGPGCAEEFEVTGVEAFISSEWVKIIDHITDDHMDCLTDLCMEDYHSQEPDDER